MQHRGHSEIDARGDRSPPRGRRAALLAAVCLAAAACGDPAPEERLAEARAELAEANEEIARLEERVEEKRRAVEDAEQALERAREEYAQAQDQLAQARQRIERTATDVALFRAVQNALLQNDALEDFAIRVEVEGGVVTLRGEVDEPGQADEAVETARRVGGVDGVVNEIEVRESESGGAEGRNV